MPQSLPQSLPQASIQPPESAASVPNLRFFERRSPLPMLTGHLWQLQSGVVRTVTWTEEGKTITLGIWGTGDVVGKALGIGDPYHAECLTRVSAVPLPQHLWYQATDAIIQHTRHSKTLLEIVRYGNAEASLLRLLTWLAQRFGHAEQSGWQIDLRLTHQELADLSGLTRVTVTRLLKSFQEQGLIQRNQNQIFVLPECQPFWHYEI